MNRRHVHFVYSAALRLIRAAHLAKEVIPVCSQPPALTGTQLCAEHQPQQAEKR